MMEDAVQAVMRSGRTSEPTLHAIFLSEQINRRHGGALVAPWELDEMPEDFLMAYQALFAGVRQTQQKNQLEKYFRDARRRHPTYRKYVH